MLLYTINATWVRPNDSAQDKVQKAAEYAGVVARILGKNGIDGFTIYETIGFWKGEREVSYKIEMALDAKEMPYHKVRTIAKALRDYYNQESVMMTFPNGTVEFI